MSNTPWINVKDKPAPKDRPVLAIAQPLKIPDASLKWHRLVAQYDKDAEQFRPVDIPSMSPGTPPDLKITHWAEVPDFPPDVPSSDRG